MMLFRAAGQSVKQVHL